MNRQVPLAWQRVGREGQLSLDTPALDLWHRRGWTDTYDDLWRAACWEAQAAELYAAGHHDLALSSLRRAEEILGG